MLTCAYPALDRPMILFQNVVEIDKHAYELGTLDTSLPVAARERTRLSPIT
jgi:hypothetical protein